VVFLNPSDTFRSSPVSLFEYNNDASRPVTMS
jgi:hypothetical protein